MEAQITRVGAGRTAPNSQDYIAGDTRTVLDSSSDGKIEVADPYAGLPIVDVLIELGPLNEGLSCTVRWAQACQHCKVFHRHGYETAWLKPFGALLGHRGAHCDGARKEYPNGYLMRLVGSTPAVPRAKLKAAPRRSAAIEHRLAAVISFEFAQHIVCSIAKSDARYAMTEVIPDKSNYPEPLALCSSKDMTIAVPAKGVILGSLVSEIALLLVPGLGAPVFDYDAHRSQIEKTVIKLSKELLQ
jgi:hypothetical protein